jgi:capping protein alpha
MSDGASPQQKLNIANYFIKSAPINEVKFALADVEKLVADPAVLNNDTKAKILRDYNINQLVHVEDSNGNKFLLTPFNEVSDSVFADPETGKAWSIDHVQKTVTGEASGYSAGAHESLRAAVSVSLKKYTATHYKKDKCVFGVFADGSQLTICVSAINTNLNAYWTGNWRAVYKLPLSGGSLESKLEVNVHYFEDGNVQLNAAFAAPAVTVAAEADAIAAAVEKIETEWQANLEKMYIDMHHQTFKQMRRALPLNKMTMNWTSAAHSLAEELGGK